MGARFGSVQKPRLEAVERENGTPAVEGLKTRRYVSILSRTSESVGVPQDGVHFVLHHLVQRKYVEGAESSDQHRAVGAEIVKKGEQHAEGGAAHNRMMELNGGFVWAISPAKCAPEAYASVWG
ncbi:hypothetical protein DPX39_060009900 [Trypanosoma brucei equiperdum]|uniref:Uncharacterized protein n=1 Tax=Trypanosoma brucei equiperdum TaxID=630700 RepID=A0A3L6L6P8_9TRYP|nr:hypothetical protein DPX39_060009900 [Trypanosoma brucei equiperdum]